MELAKQNILFIVRTMGLGGTENVVLQLCEILSEKVNRIVICSSGGVHEEKLKKMGVVHYTIPDIASKNPLDMLKICLKIKHIIRSEKISIIHSHHRMAAFYAELIATNRMPKLATAHNTFQDKKRLTHFAYHNTKLIAVGEMVKNNLKAVFKIPENQITVIHNAVKPYEDEIKPLAILEEEKKKGHILVGNIGRLSEQKGMCYFIDAAEITLQKHPETHFIIVGDGEQREQLLKMVDSKKIQNRITFLGYRADIQNVMSQLDFIVLSSLWEGLPLTPIEAFSVGKTVIGTSVDGTPEIICNGIDGYLVEPRNSEQLAEKMIDLIENPTVRKNLEMHALKRYKEEFSFEKLTQRYIEFYEEL